jgi:hypothetical protein
MGFEPTTPNLGKVKVVFFPEFPKISERHNVL